MLTLKSQRLLDNRRICAWNKEADVFTQQYELVIFLMVRMPLNKATDSN